MSIMYLQPLAELLQNKKKKIVFATGSESRKQALREKGLGFIVFESSECDESTNETDPEKYVIEIATRKAEAVANSIDADVVIGADTVVTIDNRILIKPDGANEAEIKESASKMLRRLSGRENVVVTGVVMLFKDKTKVSFFEKTSVFFDTLTDEQIRCYVNSGEPNNKAGGYAIQGLAGTFIKRINGDYFSVLGAPVHGICTRLYEWIN